MSSLRLRRRYKYIFVCLSREFGVVFGRLLPPHSCVYSLCISAEHHLRYHGYLTGSCVYIQWSLLNPKHFVSVQKIIFATVATSLAHVYPWSDQGVNLDLIFNTIPQTWWLLVYSLGIVAEHHLRYRSSRRWEQGGPYQDWLEAGMCACSWCVCVVLYCLCIYGRNLVRTVRKLVCVLLMTHTRCFVWLLRLNSSW